jgi:hypothetical protein
MRMLRLPSPATVIALLALFFALGGSAFALGQATAARYQLRCQAGAVRGVVVVKGDDLKGMANIPSTFTGNARLFARRFNCSGGAITVRRAEFGVYDVKFGGNSANVGVASSAVDGAVSVTRNTDGSFRVVVYSPQADNNRDIQVDKPFQLVIV